MTAEYLFYLQNPEKKIRTNENNRPVVFVYQTRISERTSSHTFEFKILKLSLVIVEFQSGHHHRTHFSPSNHANPCQSLDTPQDSVSCNKNFQNLKSIIPTSFQIKTMSDNKATIRPIIYGNSSLYFPFARATDKHNNRRSALRGHGNRLGRIRHYHKNLLERRGKTERQESAYCVSPVEAFLRGY